MAANPPNYEEALAEAATPESRITHLETSVRELRGLVEQLGTELRLQKLRFDEYVTQAEDRARRAARVVVEPEQKRSLPVLQLATFPTTEEIVTMKKVTNAMLYLKYALGRNLDGLRARYIQPENIQLMRDRACGEIETFLDAPCETQDQEYERHHALGGALWLSLCDKEKDHVRDLYAAWKVNMKALVGVDIAKAKSKR